MKYREAIAQATVQAMSADPKVIIMGAGVADPKGIFGTTLAAREAYPERVIETPLSENMLTGSLCGLALAGYKPIFVNARADFLPLAMEPIVNTITKWGYTHGQPDKPMPVTIRAIIGYGWGQGPQHSQSLTSMFAHVPGLNVLMPYTVADAYHAVIDGIQSQKPTLILEHRRLYETEGSIEWKPSIYAYRDDQILMTPYSEVTVVAVGAATLDAVEAIKRLRQTSDAHDVDVIVCRRWPLRDDIIKESVRRTGRLVVVDTDWKQCGLSAEIVAICAEAGVLQKPPIRISPPFMPCPTSERAEAGWYPSPGKIARAIDALIDPGVYKTELTAEEVDARSSTPLRDGIKEPF